MKKVLVKFNSIELEWKYIYGFVELFVGDEGIVFCFEFVGRYGKFGRWGSGIVR